MTRTRRPFGPGPYREGVVSFVEVLLDVVTGVLLFGSGREQGQQLKQSSTSCVGPLPILADPEPDQNDHFSFEKRDKDLREPPFTMGSLNGMRQQQDSRAVYKLTDGGVQQCVLESYFHVQLLPGSLKRSRDSTRWETMGIHRPLMKTFKHLTKLNQTKRRKPRTSTEVFLLEASLGV